MPPADEGLRSWAPSPDSIARGADAPGAPILATRKAYVGRGMHNAMLTEASGGNGPGRSMDDEEAAGLRAFGLRVGCDGASYPERPAWVERDGLRVDVASVESQWREEERLGFRLLLIDGSHLLVYYVSEFDLWSGIIVAAGPASGGA